MPISPAPYQKISLRTHLTPEEIVARLHAQVAEGDPLRRYLFKKPSQPFNGRIEASTFRIARIIRYRNSFLPIVHGEIRDDLDRRVIDMTLYPAIFVLVFLGAVLLFAAMIFVTMLVDLFLNGNPTGSPVSIVLMPLFILFGFYGVMVLSFNFEANKAITLLKDMLDASEL